MPELWRMRICLRGNKMKNGSWQVNKLSVFRFPPYLFPVEYPRFAFRIRFDAANVVNVCRAQRGHEAVK